MSSDIYQVKDVSDEYANQEIFESEEDMRQSLVRFYYGDLYVLGRMWIIALKAILVGTKACFIPTIKAAPPQVPQRPPPMKASELPLYQSPLFDYKDYREDQQKCPGISEKIMHAYLLPTVSGYRKCYCKTLCSIKQDISDTYKEVTTEVSGVKNNFKSYMRHPNHCLQRQACLVISPLIGFYLGGSGCTSRRMLYTAIGAAASSALCFPKKSDEGFRNLLYHSAKGLLCAYNCYCGKDHVMRPRVPCAKDLPEIKPAKQSVQCRKR